MLNLLREKKEKEKKGMQTNVVPTSECMTQLSYVGKPLGESVDAIKRAT